MKNRDDPDERKGKLQARRRDNDVCQMCGDTKDLSVHHIKPKRKGGGHELHNLVTLCRDCHDWADSACRVELYTPDTWWQYLLAMRSTMDWKGGSHAY